MLAVMELQRLGRHVRLERVLGIGQRFQLKGHGFTPSQNAWTRMDRRGRERIGACARWNVRSGARRRGRDAIPSCISNGERKPWFRNENSPRFTGKYAGPESATSLGREG